MINTCAAFSLSMLLLCSCKPAQKEPVTAEKKQHAIGKSTEKTDQEPTSITADQSSNALLHNSFLQEMADRKIVTVSGNVLTAKIHFNLHSPDCGAPDCYTTEVRFSFSLGEELILPKQLKFKESEYGCIEEEFTLNGVFQLVEKTSKHVIYHCPKVKRTLVLFRSAKTTSTGAFYFTNVDRNTVTGKNVYTVCSNYNEEDENALYPFTSTALSAIEQ